MDVTYRTDNDQTALWNGLAGRAWVEAQELLDQVFRPLQDLLVESVGDGSGRRLVNRIPACQASRSAPRALAADLARPARQGPCGPPIHR